MNTNKNISNRPKHYPLLSFPNPKAFAELSETIPDIPILKPMFISIPIIPRPFMSMSKGVAFGFIGIAIDMETGVCVCIGRGTRVRAGAVERAGGAVGLAAGVTALLRGFAFGLAIVAVFVGGKVCVAVAALGSVVDRGCPADAMGPRKPDQKES